MTFETPKHGDLLVALADLPPRKVEKFAIALGVPKNVVEESQINNPKDVYHVKSDALDWWIRNENASWEAIAKALEAKGVDERNLAKRIRSSHGLVPAENGKSVPFCCLNVNLVVFLCQKIYSSTFATEKQLGLKPQV